MVIEHALAKINLTNLRIVNDVGWRSACKHFSVIEDSRMIADSEGLSDIMVSN